MAPTRTSQGGQSLGCSLTLTVLPFQASSLPYPEDPAPQGKRKRDRLQPAVERERTAGKGKEGREPVNAKSNVGKSKKKQASAAVRRKPQGSTREAVSP